MKGILPTADDWQQKLPDGRILAVGFFNYGEGGNLNCVLQKDATNGADSSADFILVHSINDIQDVMTPANCDDLLERFTMDANSKLAAILDGVKPQIPTGIWDRMNWHFRWSFSFNVATNKIVFTKPS